MSLEGFFALWGKRERKKERKKEGEREGEGKRERRTESGRVFEL